MGDRGLMWRYIAAKVVGSSHIRVQQPCQDSFACSTELPGWFVAAIADGAGSAEFSELGAETAVSETVRFLLEALATYEGDYSDIVRSAMVSARARVLLAAEGLGVSQRDLASTLLVVAIGPHGGAAGQIGDGVIAVKEDAEDWIWVFWPHKGEYANQTRFLIDDDAVEQIETSRLLANIFEVCLITDGLESVSLHFATRSVHARFFDGFASPLRCVDTTGWNVELSAALADFLDSEAVRSRSTDDLTLVLASRLSQ